MFKRLIHANYKKNVTLTTTFKQKKYIRKDYMIIIKEWKEDQKSWSVVCGFESAATKHAFSYAQEIRAVSIWF